MSELAEMSENEQNQNKISAFQKTLEEAQQEAKGKTSSSVISDDEASKAAKLMFNSAVQVDEIEEQAPEKRPFHFDLVGLAQGLHKTASVAQHIGKLKAHVQDAEKALNTHTGHVNDIKALLAKAEGD